MSDQTEPSAENDATTIRVSMTPQQWADQLAHAWDKGYEAATRRHVVGLDRDHEANPYRVIPPDRSTDA